MSWKNKKPPGIKAQAHLKFNDGELTDDQLIILTLLGFKLFSRQRDNWVIYTRKYGEEKELPYNVVIDLEKRVDNLIKPYKGLNETRGNMINIIKSFMRSRSSAHEREWVANWIIENIDKVADKDLPWNR